MTRASIYALVFAKSLTLIFRDGNFPSAVLTYLESETYPWESDANYFAKTSQKKFSDLYNVEKSVRIDW